MKTCLCCRTLCRLCWNICKTEDKQWTCKNSMPRHYHEVLEVVWSGKMCAVPEAVIDKMQAYQTPKNVNEMKSFEGIWGFGKSFIPPGTVPLSLIPPGKERAHVGLGIRAASSLQAGRNELVKQMKALGISQVGLPFEFVFMWLCKVWAGHCGNRRESS